MIDNEPDNSFNISQKTPEELIRIIKNTPDGSYAFLIGAGTSRPEPAEIPLAKEMERKFKSEIYAEENDREKDLNSWANDFEEKHGKRDQSDYSFWFQKVCPNREARQTRITELVDGAKPPLGQLILAKLMQDGVVSHVFTPNFDDLLVNASIDLPGRRPLFVDHDARASRVQYSIDRPAIIKLHGDYKHYTRNTDSETKELDENIKNAFKQSLQRYGLVVVGYGGRDESIMSVLNETEISDKGLYWCKLDDSDLNTEVKSLLHKKDDAYLVNIEGSEGLFSEFINRTNEFNLPDSDLFVKRAEEIGDRIDDLVEKKDGLDIGYKRRQDKKGTGVEIQENEAISESSDGVSEVINSVENENYDEAASLLDSIIENIENEIGDELPNEEVSYAYLAKGQIEVNRDEYEQGLENINQAVKANPKNSDAYRARGKINDEHNKHSDAIEDFTKALEIDSEDEISYYYRGQSNVSLGNYEDAIDDYTKAIEFAEDYADAYGARAMTKTSMGQYKEAINDATKSIEIDPESSDSFRVRGAAKLRLDQYEEAIEDLNKAIRLNSENAAAYLNSGIAKTEIGDQEGAIEDFTECIEINPDEPRNFELRAKTYAQLDNYEEVINDMNEAIDIKPGNPEYYTLRAKARSEYGTYREAISDAKQALQLGNEDSINAGIMATAKLNLGEYEDAIEDFNRIIDDNAENPINYLERAEAYIGVGKFEAVKSDAVTARDQSTNDYHKVISILFELISSYILDENISQLEELYHSELENEFDMTWKLDELRAVLNENDLSKDDKKQVNDWIDSLSEKSDL